MFQTNNPAHGRGRSPRPHRPSSQKPHKIGPFRWTTLSSSDTIGRFLPKPWHTVGTRRPRRQPRGWHTGERAQIMRGKFTQRFVNSAKDGTYTDGSGLYLIVRKSGRARSW